jgi:hypothetical protein
MGLNEQLSHHNSFSNDVALLSDKELKKLGRYERFEKQFPFYTMCIGGYSRMIRQALDMHRTIVEEPQASCVSHGALVHTFKQNPTWADLASKQSQLSQFLYSTCKDDIKPEMLSVQKLMILGILWCEGDDQEKAVQFFELLQGRQDSRIAANDKDFKPNLYMLFDFATEIVFENEHLIMGTSRSVTKRQTKKAKEQYEEFAEEFLDEVFE